MVRAKEGAVKCVDDFNGLVDTLRDVAKFRKQRMQNEESQWDEFPLAFFFHWCDTAAV